ncbi:hypothetical protein L7F22_006889 [Adiantum nelumboides]|nr:hypothetical protein [Adiantum nelumboides]
METSDVRPSFLCFLPEFECTPASSLYMNGLTEVTRIEHFSGKAVTVARPKKQSLNEIESITNRLSDASLEAETCVSNCFAQSKAVIGLVANGVLDDLNDTAVGRVSHSSDNRGSGNDQIAECNGNPVLVDESMEEVDLLAFKITEFFDAFREGQEHNLWKFTQTLEMRSPESLVDSDGDQWSLKTNPALVDQRMKSDKVITQVDEDIMDSRISSSAGRSGKWNGFIEADSFSATLSGPLTFSGPMSYSGISSYGPQSGSVSHRSDSSTASTHSFAFPILPYEWNSSPVKMAQPDKRFLQRPWKRRLRSFFCCADPFK